MTSAIDRMTALNLTPERFAAITGTHKATVRGWEKMRTTGSGRRPQSVPGWVPVLLDAWEKHPNLIPPDVK